MVATRQSPGVKGTIAAALFLSLAGSLGLSQRGADTAQAPAAAKPECTFTVQNDVATPMRDGTVLRSNVYTPDGPGPYPILMVRTPYNKDRPFNGAYGAPDAWAGNCYIVVSQDVRGQYKSDGIWYPFRSEATDGYDAIEWAAALPKSNGKVGMYGFSYPGATQWLPATLRPPHLTAIIPAMTSSDYRDGWTYEGGALYQAFTRLLADEQHREQRRAAPPGGHGSRCRVRGRAAGLRRQVEVVPAAEGLCAAAPGGSAGRGLPLRLAEASRGRRLLAGVEHPEALGAGHRAGDQFRGLVRSSSSTVRSRTSWACGRTAARSSRAMASGS